MAEPRRHPPSHRRSFTFPNMVITLAVTPALTRPVNQVAIRIRSSRRR